MTEPFKLPIGPSNNTYKRHFCTRSTAADPHTVTARLTRKARRYKDDVGWLAKQAGVRMESGDVMLRVDVYMTRAHPLDLDNVLKLLQDSLENIAFENDRQIADTHIRRHWVSRDPHLLVQILPMEAEEHGRRKKVGDPVRGGR